MIKPTFNNVVLKKIEYQKETETGIVIAQADKQDGDFFEVLSVGPMAEQVEEGDTVVVGDFMAEKIQRADKEYYIAKDEDILGICES